MIMNKTHKILESEAFLSISRDTLSNILDIETCEVKEVDVFKACLKWARQTCGHGQMEATGMNLRAALGDCITKFKFSDVGDFARDICPSGVLTRDEEYGILRHLVDRQVIPAPPGFNCEARLRPIYHLLVNSEEMEQIYCRNLDFIIRINSNNNNRIKVKKIFIGKAQSDSMSINLKYNDKPVQSKENTDDNLRLPCLNCNSELIIEPGSSTLRVTYINTNGNVLTNSYLVTVPQREILLKGDNDHPLLKLSTNNNCVPVYGFTCENVY